MKHKVGDKTILGEITRISEIVDNPYIVKNEGFSHYFSESEIDAIVIKPKRNIDHLIELIEARKKEEAVSFIDNCQQSTSWSFWLHMLDEYVEPRKYPVLTPEEFKAIKWLTDDGAEEIHRQSNGSWITNKYTSVCSCLYNSTWLTTEPINLAELLEAQEDV